MRFGAQATRVDGARCSTAREPHELTRRLRPLAGRRAAGQADDAPTARPVERLLDVEVRPLVSVFLPDRLELLKGPPALRRAHLDQLVAALWPPRAATRREYSRVLAQRNALLARIRAGPRLARDAADWDRELAAPGARAARATAPRPSTLLAEPFAERAAQLGLQRRG